jgi:hypothetical protein
MAFKDGRLNPQDKSRLGCHGGIGINLFAKLYPNMMEASLVRKWENAWLLLGRIQNATYIFFLKNSHGFSHFPTWAKLSLRKLKVYNCMILAIAPLASLPCMMW